MKPVSQFVFVVALMLGISSAIFGQFSIDSQRFNRLALIDNNQQLSANSFTRSIQQQRVSLRMLSSETASASKNNVWGELGVWAGSIGLIMLTDSFDEPDLPDCAPCSKSEVPFYDRWVIHNENTEWQVVGWTHLLGFGLYSWVDVWRTPDRGFSHFRASIESSLLAAAFAGFLKDTFHRRRQVYFTDKINDIDGAERRDALRSFPSGDTAIAFALSTSYLLSKGNNASDFQKYFALGAATMSGVGRIAGGKHFPTDVLAGAALGALSAYIVHWMRF